MTIETYKLLEQERDALNGLCGALANLANVRNAQVLDEKKNTASYEADARSCDLLLEKTHQDIESIMQKHFIDYEHGKTPLECIDARIEKLKARVAELEPEMPF